MKKPNMLNIYMLAMIIFIVFLISKSFIFINYETVCSEDLSDLAMLPVDSGGELRAYSGREYHNSKNGFYLYLPAGWKQARQKYPLLVFYHGSGANGNSVLDKTDLRKVLKNGPLKMVRNNNWDPPVPFIILAPQFNALDNGTLVSAVDTTKFWVWLTRDFPINRARIYLTGPGQGGFVIFNTLGKYGGRLGLAAAVPLCGGYWDRTFFMQNAHRMVEIPVWAFHGEKDRWVNCEMSKTIVRTINQHKTVVPARLTLFTDLSHNVWDTVYENRLGTERTNPDYTPYDQDIYSWMLHFRRIKKVF